MKVVTPSPYSFDGPISKYNNAYTLQALKKNIMDTISYSAFRTHLASTLDKVNDDHKPILVTRQNGKHAVVMSLEDFHAYEETAYLMTSPKNAERLSQTIADVEAGKVVSRALIEE